MTTDQLGSRVHSKRPFMPLVPGRVAVALVSVGAAIMLTGFFLFGWVVPIDFSHSPTGLETCYGWWKLLIPAVAVLVFVALMFRSSLENPRPRIFWIGIAVAGIISLYPFYRLLNPGTDNLLGAVSVGHAPGVWLVSEAFATFASSGFFITLAGTLLLTVGALSGLPGKQTQNDE